ncbi:hypothetical protein HYW46_04460 [Candidatus Daviesbacteria bacterium]|nr:hypothetical protein [Candidatus Daviesbacteria bacterium]
MMFRKTLLIFLITACSAALLFNFTPTAFTQEVPSDLGTGFGGCCTDPFGGGSDIGSFVDSIMESFGGFSFDAAPDMSSGVAVDAGTADALTDTAVNDQGETNGKVPASPPDPNSFLACIGGDPASLSWQPAANLSYYNVFRTDLNGTPLNGTGLLGQYFDSKDLTHPMMTRIDPPGADFTFNWGLDTPDPKISPESFSVKWIGKIKAPSTGAFTFYTNAQSDKGAVLYIDDEIVIDKWNQPGEFSGTISMTQGKFYNIRLEYQSYQGAASMSLSWTGPGIPVKTPVPKTALFPGFSNGVNMQLANNDPITETNKPIIFTDGSGNGDGLFGAYYDNLTLQPPMATFRIDPPQPKTDFDFSDWANQAPDPTINSSTNYSVVWSGKVKAPATGTFTFYFTTSDGLIVSIAEDTRKEFRIIENWGSNRALTEDQGNYDLIKDKMYDIKIKHYFNGGAAGDGAFKMSWSCASCSPSLSKQAIPRANLYRTIDINFNQGFYAQYYDNADLVQLKGDAGAPVNSRFELQPLNFTWGTSPPSDSLVTADNFSVKWTGMLKTPNETGTYKFYVTTQAAAKLIITTDTDTQVINKSNTATAETTPSTNSIDLEAGQLYRMELSTSFTTGDASMVFSWQTPSMILAGTPAQIIPASQFLYHTSNLPMTIPSGTLGKYFDNQNLSAQTLSRIDATIDHTQPPWTAIRPSPEPYVPITPADPFINTDTFSMRWVGKIKIPETGIYQFTVWANDGAAIFMGLGGKKYKAIRMTDCTGTYCAVTISPTDNFIAGKTYDFRVEYYFNQTTDIPHIQLRWKRPTMAAGTTEVIPATAFYHGAVNSSPILYTDPGAVPGQVYWYQVSSVGPSGNIFSRWVFNTAASCSYPVVTATANCMGDTPKVDLSWTQNAAATEYRIYRSDAPTTVLHTTDAAEFASRTWTDTTVARNTVYGYTVAPYNPTDGELPQSKWYSVVTNQPLDANDGTNKTPWCDNTPPVADFNFIFSADQCFTPLTWPATPPQPIQATATDSASLVKSVTFRLSQCTSPDCSTTSSNAEYPASQPDPITYPNLWEKTFNGTGDLNNPPFGGVGYKYKLELQAENYNNKVLDWTAPRLFRYANSCVADWIQTTGGDVHSNTNIDTVGGP